MSCRKAFVALFAAGIAPAQAQLASESAPQEVAAVDAASTIIVTASRIAERADQTLAPVTVITREDIQRLKPRDLPELLIGLPGVTLTRYGGPGKQTSLFLRGANSDQMVVLIDGLKAGSATAGTMAYEQIPVDLIERIEIVRGPRSSLYGSEAIGGVMQIFTRRGSAGGALTPAFAIGGGNYGSGRVEGSLRGGFGSGGWYNLGLSGSTTDGINAQPSAAEPDHDGFRSAAGTLNLGWNFANGAALEAHWLRADSHNEFDDAWDYANESYNRQQMFGGSARFSPLARWQVNLSAGQTQDFADTFHDTLVDDYMGGLTHNRSSINTYRDSYAWQNDVQLGERQRLSGGLDFTHDRVGGDTAYTQRERDNLGVYAQYLGGWRGHELQLSGRYDDNEQYGTHKTGAVAYGYRFANGLRIGASYASAFRAPSFNDLYYPGYGVPDLEPETSHNVELGIAGTHALAASSWNWALNAYRNSVDQLIVYNPVIPPFGAPENIGEARILGVEAQLGAVIRGVRAQIYFNWLDTENRSVGANHGKELPRRAQQAGRLELDYDWRAFSVGSTVFVSGRRYDDAANTTRLGAYGTLDLRADWRVASAWTVQLKVANVLDKHYETAATYASMGSSWFVTLRYAPGERAAR